PAGLREIPLRFQGNPGWLLTNPGATIAPPARDCDVGRVARTTRGSLTILRAPRAARVSSRRRKATTAPTIDASGLVDRRGFVSMAVAGAASPLLQRVSVAQPVPKARNVVLLHGLFADGSCWSEVIARLQPKGMQVTAVQNPLTSLQASVEATQRVLAM